jgi:hypothetical protein
MKKLFKLTLREYDTEIESETEVIAATQADAVINAIQTYKNSVIEVTPIPWDTMTVAQKTKVIDADWDEHERKMRNSVTVDDMLKTLRKLKNKILSNNSTISNYYTKGITS